MSWGDIHGPCPTCGVNVPPEVHDCPVYPAPLDLRIPSHPEEDPCAACNAEPGEPCRPGCLGYALEHGEL